MRSFSSSLFLIKWGPICCQDHAEVFPSDRLGCPNFPCALISFFVLSQVSYFNLILSMVASLGFSIFLIDRRTRIKVLLARRMILVLTSLLLLWSGNAILKSRVPLLLFIVSLMKRSRWRIFVTKILLLLRSHLIAILIITGFSKHLIVRFLQFACFWRCVHRSSEHRIEDLYHVRCLWMIESGIRALSVFLLETILRPIREWMIVPSLMSEIRRQTPKNKLETSLSLGEQAASSLLTSVEADVA